MQLWTCQQPLTFFIWESGDMFKNVSTHKDNFLGIFNIFVVRRQIIMHTFEEIKTCMHVRTYAYAPVCICMQAAYFCKNTCIFARRKSLRIVMGNLRKGAKGYPFQLHLVIFFSLSELFIRLFKLGLGLLLSLPPAKNRADNRRFTGALSNNYCRDLRVISGI